MMKITIYIFILISLVGYSSCISKNNKIKQTAKTLGNPKKDSLVKASKSGELRWEDSYELFIDTTIILENDKIEIASYKKTNMAWNGAHGAIVTNRNSINDTIYDGCFGHAPDFKIISINNKLFLETCSTILGGGNNWESISLLSLQQGNFLDTLFSENINISSESSLIESFRYTCSKEFNIDYYDNQMIITVDSLCKKVHGDSWEVIETSSSGRRYIKTELF